MTFKPLHTYIRLTVYVEIRSVLITMLEALEITVEKGLPT